MTLAELDWLRAESTKATETVRAFKADYFGECEYCGEYGLHVQDHITYIKLRTRESMLKQEVEQALQEWWAQGCRE